MRRYVYKYFLVTGLFAVAVGLLFSSFFLWHRKPLIKTQIRHVSSPTKNAIPPDLPVFSANRHQPTDKTTVVHTDKRDMSTFTAYIMTVSDPRKVSIVTTKDLGIAGQTVEEIVKGQNAIAGINGGSFLDTNWQGNGGQVEGIVISDGKVIVPSRRVQNIVGFTSSGRLFSGTYSLSELKAMHVAQALTFGPTLVTNGVGVVQGDGSWGFAPRTAIGQKADGTVIMMVTDGRGLTGPGDTGASLRDIQNLMLQYGAVTAANLDGGSSATMVYKGNLVNEPTDLLGQRKIGTAVIVR